MIINKIQNDINFRAIKLSEIEIEKSEEIFQKLLNTEISQKEKSIFQSSLYDIFHRKIKKEAFIRTQTSHGFKYNFDDVFAEMNLKFCEMLNDLKNYSSLDKIIETLNGFKSSKDSIKPEYKSNFRSLDGNSYKVGSGTFKDSEKAKNIKFVREEDLPNPTSAVDIDRAKNRLGKVIEDAPINEVQKDRLQKRATGKTYEEIGISNGISTSTARRSVLQSIHKIQYNMECLPKEMIEHSKKVSLILGCDTNSFIQAALSDNSQTLFMMDPEKIKKNVEESSNIIGCSFSEFVKMGLRQPQLLYQKHEILMKNAEESSKLLGCEVGKFIKACIKQPSLFFMKSTYLLNNATESSKLLKCTLAEFVEAGLKQPNLFYLKQKTLLNNISESSKMLNCSFEEFVKAGLKQPQLFCLKPKTLFNNATESSDKLKWSLGEFVKAGLKQPQFFCMKPDTLSNKLKLENYYRKLQNKEPTNKIARFDSDKKVYSKILGTLIKNTDKSSIKKVNDYNLEQFLKSNTDKTFSFELPQDEVADDFIKFAQETSIKTIGKNIFEFKQTAK